MRTDFESVKTSGKQVALPITASQDPVRVKQIQLWRPLGLEIAGRLLWGWRARLPLTRVPWCKGSGTRMVCLLPRDLLTLFVFGFVIWDSREDLVMHFILCVLCLCVALPVFAHVDCDIGGCREIWGTLESEMQRWPGLPLRSPLSYSGFLFSKLFFL